MAVSSTSYRKAKEVKRTDRMNPGQWVWERGEMKRVQVIVKGKGPILLKKGRTKRFLRNIELAKKGLIDALDPQSVYTTLEFIRSGKAHTGKRTFSPEKLQAIAAIFEAMDMVEEAA